MAEKQVRKAAAMKAKPAKQAADTEGHMHTRKEANKKAGPSKKSALRK